MGLNISVTTQFKKDIKLARKQGRDIDKLLKVVDKIANRETLELKYRDHALVGKYSNSRECHIEPDWLLIYTIFENKLILVLNRVGSHSDLFN